MDKKFFLALLFLSAVGITTGCFFEIYLTGTGKTQLMDLLSDFFRQNPADHPFLLSTLQNIRSGLFFLVPAFFVPVLPFLLPINLAMLFSRGLFLGFSSCMLLETFGKEGLLYMIVTLIPIQILYLLLFCCLLSCSAEKFHTPGLRRKGIRKALHHLAGLYSYTYAAGLAVLLLIGLLQTILLQAVTGS